jgi:hypothetical protein
MPVEIYSSQNINKDSKGRDRSIHFGTPITEVTTDETVIPEAYEYKNVTEEAVDLLVSIDDSGMLPGLNNNVKRILTENEITYDASTKPEDAINALRAKATAKEKTSLSFKEVSERLEKRRPASAKKKKLDNIDKFFLEVTENLQKDFDKAARSFDEKKIPKSTTNTYKRDFNEAIEKDDITEARKVISDMESVVTESPKKVVAKVRKPKTKTRKKIDTKPKTVPVQPILTPKAKVLTPPQREDVVEDVSEEEIYDADKGKVKELKSRLNYQQRYYYPDILSEKLPYDVKRKEVSIKNLEYSTVVDDPTSNTDKNKIIKLRKNQSLEYNKDGSIENSSNIVTPKRSAELFFSKHDNPTDVLNSIAHYIGFKVISVKPAKGADVYQKINYARNTGLNYQRAVKAKEWIDANLSQDTKDALDTAINDQTKEAGKKQLSKEVIEADDRKKLTQVTDAGNLLNQKNNVSVEQYKRQLYEALKTDDRAPITLADLPFEFSLLEDAVEHADTKLHPDVVKALLQGDLVGALSALKFTASSTPVSDIATGMLKNIGTTKVRLVENLKVDGKKAAGSFDPKTNTIKLDTKTGINGHTLLHEMAHAVTSATIKQKPNSSPVKQLTQIFNDAKGKLGTVYGTQNLDEFVAEYMGNPKFREELAQIKLKRSPLTLGQRFNRAIGNILRFISGRPLVSVNALTDMDTIYEGLVAPAPRFRNATEIPILLESKAKLQDFVKRTTDNYYAIDKETGLTSKQKFLDSVVKFFDIGSSGAKIVGMRAATSQMLSDILDHYGVNNAIKIHRQMELQKGDVDKAEAPLDGVLTRLRNWKKANSETGRVTSGPMIERFNKIVHDSTFERVDPSKPRIEYSGFWLTYNITDSKGKVIRTERKAYSTAEKRTSAIGTLKNLTQTKNIKNVRVEKNPEERKVKVYDSMQADWKKLGKEGQQVYKSMRDTYKQLYIKLKANIFNRIDSLIEDKKQRSLLKNEILSKLFKAELIDPYFPLTRQGDYWLTYNIEVYDKIENKTTTEIAVEAFEGPSERARAMKILANTPGVTDIVDYVNAEAIDYNKAPPSSWVAQTLRVLNDNIPDTKSTTLSANGTPVNAKQETINEVMRMFVAALPESSFAKSLQKREDRLGYNEDAELAFQTKAYNLARQTEQLKYAEILRQTVKEIDTSAEEKVKESDSFLSRRAAAENSKDKKKLAQVNKEIATYEKEKGPLLSSANKRLAMIELQKRVDFAINPPSNVLGKKRTTRKQSRLLRYYWV